MPHLTLGVDIGTRGGLALLTRDGALVLTAPMPVLDDGPKGRPAVNAPLLSALLRQCGPTEAFVGYVSARPKGTSRGFRLRQVQGAWSKATGTRTSSRKRCGGRSQRRG